MLHVHDDEGERRLAVAIVIDVAATTLSSPETAKSRRITVHITLAPAALILPRSRYRESLVLTAPIIRRFYVSEIDGAPYVHAILLRHDRNAISRISFVSLRIYDTTFFMFLPADQTDVRNVL